MNLPTAPEFSEITAPPKKSTEEPVVVLENVTVRYRVPRERFRTFKEFAIRRMQGKVQYVDLLAIDNLDLQVFKGEVVGLIGANGAGKTTLLRLVARVMRPTSGRVIVR